MQPRLLASLSLLVAALNPTAHLRAQSQSPAEPTPSASDTIHLSPFEVTAATETGYVASQTLAGTRIATDIQNVAAQITVMTPEFLQDIAATSFEEAALYSLNVDSAREVSTDANVDGANGVERLNSNRARGLTDASLTRDFFGTWFALDSYNSERYTFNSGPNAILFGLGSPSGVVDQTLKRARYRDSNQVVARIDSFDGYRGQFDANRVLIPKVLAVRASLLYGRGEYYQKPARDLQRRQYLTATWDPFSKTTIRASVENIRRDASVPRNTLIKDGITPYLDWRAQRMRQLGTNDPLDPRLYWAPNNLLNPGETPFTTGFGTPFATTAPAFPFLMTGNLSPDTPTAALLGRIAGTASATNPVATGAISRGPHEDAIQPVDRFSYSLTDSSIFPFDINPNGLGTDNRQKGTALNLAVEHRFTRDLVIEAAYQREAYDMRFVDWLRGVDRDLGIDVNRYVPNVADAAGRPVLNPNRGKLYLDSWGRGRDEWGHTDSARLTASWKLDFARRTGWQRWLGTHSFAGLADFHRAVSRGQNHRTLLYTDTVPAGFVATPANRNQHQLNHRAYFFAPGAPAAGDRGYYDIERDVSRLYHQPFGRLTDATVELEPTDPEKGVWAPGQLESTRTLGRMFALQSLFWRDRIIVTYGRRADAFKSAENNTPVVGPEAASPTRPWYWNNLQNVDQLPLPGLDHPTIDETGSRETRGIVVAPFSWVSVHYNESSNNRPGSPGRNPNGGFHAPSAGEGQDYGFSLRLPGRSAFLKVNWYENTQVRAGGSDATNLINFEATSIENRLEDLGEQNPQVGFKPVTTWDTVAQGTPSLSDRTAKGLEISLVANPLRNWRLSITAAKTESIETNISPEWFQYAAAREPEWTKFNNFPWAAGGDVAAGAETVRQHVDREIYFERLDRARLLEGRPSDNVRKWRVNVVTSYDFERGWIKGFGLGGAVRWRDQAAIGLPLVTLSDGRIIQDIEHPFHDDGTLDLDGWLSYRARFSNKLRARFQLNVRNLLDADKLLPQKADTTGVRRLFTLQTPRQFILTSTFDF